VEGEEIDFSRYQGKCLLIVNTRQSNWIHTPVYGS
jgi:glutathione peroxidase-family protein